MHAAGCAGGAPRNEGRQEDELDAPSQDGGSPDSSEWTTLISSKWQLAAGEEILSMRVDRTIEEDVYVGSVRPLTAEGTHHAAVLLDGPFIGDVLYSFGIGANEFVFPEGVAMKIPAGETLVLALHLFNPSTEPLEGTSGLEIIDVDSANIEHEVDLFVPGPLEFSIPPLAEHTHTGVCTVRTKQTIFALFPHMHALGVHLRTTLETDESSSVLHDGDFDLQHQAIIPLEPTPLHPGDRIITECTWQNPNGFSVGYGASATDEMCGPLFLRYPKQDDGTFCDDSLDE